MGLERLLKACFRSETAGFGSRLEVVPRKKSRAGTDASEAELTAPTYASAEWNPIKGFSGCRDGSEQQARASKSAPPEGGGGRAGAVAPGRLAAHTLKALGACSQHDSSLNPSYTAAAAAGAAITDSQRCDHVTTTATATSLSQCLTQYGEDGTALGTGVLGGALPLPQQPTLHPQARTCYYDINPPQHRRQQQAQFVVADLGFSAAGAARATTTAITPLTSSALQTPPGLTPASTREMTHTTHGSQYQSQLQLQSLHTGPSPSAPLPPPRRLLAPSLLTPLARPGEQPRPCTMPAGGASDNDSFSLPLRPPPTAPPPTCGAFSSAAAAASAPLLPPPAGSRSSFGAADLAWAASSQGPGSAGGVAGGRGSTGTGCRTLSDMPGLDLASTPPFTAATLSEMESSAFQMSRVLHAAAGSGSGGSAASAAAAAAGGGGGGGSVAVAAASAAAVGGGGSAAAAAAAAAAERRELGLIRVSSLAELSAQLEGLRWLASGSSGRVFTGLWRGSPVAVKVVLSATPDQLRDSSREALLSRVVSHPAICQCYTVCSECLTAEHLQLPRAHPATAPGVRRSASSSTPGDVLSFAGPPASPPHTSPTSGPPDSNTSGVSGASGLGGRSGRSVLSPFTGGPPPGGGLAANGDAAAPPPYEQLTLKYDRESFGTAAAMSTTEEEPKSARGSPCSLAAAAAAAARPGRVASQPGTRPALSPRAGPVSGSLRGSNSSVGSRCGAAASLPARHVSIGGGGGGGGEGLCRRGSSSGGGSVGSGRVWRQPTHVPDGGAPQPPPSSALAQQQQQQSVSPEERVAAAAAAQHQGAARRDDGAAAAVTVASAAINIGLRGGGCGGSACNSIGGGVAAAATSAMVSTLLAWGGSSSAVHAAAAGSGPSPAASLASAAAGREGLRCLAPAAVAAAAAAAELNTTLSLSELLRSYTPWADDDYNSAMQSLPAVLLSMGAVPGRYCTIVVLEWCNQGTLLQAIRSRPFNPERSPENHSGLLVLLRTALEVAQGMRYLHSLDIVHGDLKPSNVLLQSHATAAGSSGIWAADVRGYVAKVADFGLAMPAHPSSIGGVVCTLDVGGGGGDGGGEGERGHWGALAYLAPEVPDSGPSKKSDVYSYGCVLYHMCTGRQPFQGIRQGRLLLGLATGALVLTWPDSIYRVLRRLGEACCSPNPRDRPSFDKVVDALQKTITYVARSPCPSGSSRVGHDQFGSSTASTEAEAAEAAAAAAVWRSAVIGFTQLSPPPPLQPSPTTAPSQSPGCNPWALG